MPAALPLGIGLAALAGLSDLAGSAIILTGRKLLSSWFDYLLAYGTGFVLAIALAELIPAGLEGGPQNAIWVLAGFSTVYLIDKLLEGSGEPTRAGGRTVVSGIGLTMVGVTLCDFFDGVAVASAVGAAGAVSAAVGAEASEVGSLSGWFLLLGLFPHNFLEGASIALLLLRAGLGRGATWLMVIGLALASLLGGIAVQLAVPVAVRLSAQAFTGGLLLHLIASERIPGFSGPHEKRQAVLVVAGIVTFVATVALLGAVGLGHEAVEPAATGG